MAGTNENLSSGSFSITSHDTALCIIPPLPHCGHIDRLRQLYDKAYGKWPPHVNLVYPFVAPDILPRAQKQIQRHIDEHLDPSQPTIVHLGQEGHFEQRNNNTIFLRECNTGSNSPLEFLRAMVLESLSQKRSTVNLHLTIGQSEDKTDSSRDFLLAKASLLPALQFRVGALAILIRERVPGPDALYNMRLWGLINIDASGEAWKPCTPETWIRSSTSIFPTSEIEGTEEVEDPDQKENKTFSREVQPGTTFYYNSEQDNWSLCAGEELNDSEPTSVTVSSYNVLIDSEYPPARDRDPLVVRNILSDSAMADILVLQEVSDDFLSYLLQDPEVQRRYPFTSHAPPSQPEVGPLPSLRNIIVLSRYAFSWTLVPFHRRHKGAIIAHFEGLTKSSTSGLENLVVAGVHLTCGLTDGSVAAKKIQLQNLTSYLERTHSTDPWIIAGDFNITTSSYTIDTAAKNKSISSQTVAALSSIESKISDIGLMDAWSIARIEAAVETGSGNSDELFEGEEGATFDPRNNVLAAATSGTSNNRPQRYDRILVRPQDTLRIGHFNHFDLPEEECAQNVASDHSGVRATFKVIEDPIEESAEGHDAWWQLSIEHKRANADMSDLACLHTVLAAHKMFPTDEQATQRHDAFSLLKQVVLGTSASEDAVSSDIPLIMVSVGSYAMGVWTAQSDIDCLCIGTISSKTFFRLARQRLLKAEGQGVRILRKVEANTGTMLELSINGIAMDLQYCPAARVVERWSEFRNLPASDSLFNLSMLSLRKLKPYRDLLYIQRTIPSLPAFRLAYRTIKLWAVQRGLYSSRFGYLSGIHITLLLAWVCKRISHDAGSVSASDIVASFFHYYATFDWANEMVYDAFFHKKKPRYHRSTREPMVLLGFHVPNANVAHTSTVPGLQNLIKEFKEAAKQISTPGMTWEEFFGPPTDSSLTQDMPVGATDFLKTSNSFVKIDIQFWGRTLAKGKGLVGWVESRCLSLVVDIHKALPEIDVKIWPARFTERDSNGMLESNDYHGCYLIALSKSERAVTSSTKDERQIAKQALDKVLDRFLGQLKGDEKNYDSSICWIDVSLARPNEVKNMRLDDREWGDYSAEMEPDSDDEQELDDDIDELDSAPLQRVIPQRPKPTSTPLASSKLRPASDVLNRLRWDPSLDPGDYIIGYEDRFLGAMETSLSKWKTEQTDEEFIPQHRILYFKKRIEGGKGEIMWERATRIDRIFGSGAGVGGGIGATD